MKTLSHPIAFQVKFNPYILTYLFESQSGCQVPSSTYIKFQNPNLVLANKSNRVGGETKLTTFKTVK